MGATECDELVLGEDVRSAARVGEDDVEAARPWLPSPSASARRKRRWRRFSWREGGGDGATEERRGDPTISGDVSGVTEREKGAAARGVARVSWGGCVKGIRRRGGLGQVQRGGGEEAVGARRHASL